MTDKAIKRTDCVGVICFRPGHNSDEVLLIRRGTAPRKGDWSLPGGRIEQGESEEQAALRELTEETGISARLGPKIATIDADFEGFAYRLHDYVAHWTSGTPIAADDAIDAKFVRMDAIAALNMWAKTEQVIRDAHAVIHPRANEKGSLA